MKYLAASVLSFFLVAATAHAAAIPSEAELTALLKVSLTSFNSAVKKNDFTEFRKGIHSVWQEQATAQHFTEVYSGFSDSRAQTGAQMLLEEAIGLQPVFDPKPTIGKHGELIVNATYPEEPPFKITFSYLQEGGSWKLAGMDFHTETQVPSEEEIKGLDAKVLQSFNAAIKKKDFSEFYQMLSVTWKKQTTPEELKKRYQAAVDAEIDFADVLKNSTPVLSPDPTINSYQMLEVVAVYPAGDKKVTFNLKYLSESDSWKLAALAFEVDNSDKAAEDK